MSNWTNEELQFLEDNLDTMLCREIAVVLNKSTFQVKKKAKSIFQRWAQHLPEGFVQLAISPIHAINEYGTVIRIKTRRVIKPSLNAKGYLQVCLQNKYSKSVHRLVAMSFYHLLIILKELLLTIKMGTNLIIMSLILNG